MIARNTHNGLHMNQNVTLIHFWYFFFHSYHHKKFLYQFLLRWMFLSFSLLFYICILLFLEKVHKNFCMWMKISIQFENRLIIITAWKTQRDCSLGFLQWTFVLILFSYDFILVFKHVFSNTSSLLNFFIIILFIIPILMCFINNFYI